MNQSELLQRLLIESQNAGIPTGEDPRSPEFSLARTNAINSAYGNAFNNVPSHKVRGAVLGTLFGGPLGLLAGIGAAKEAKLERQGAILNAQKSALAQLAEDNKNYSDLNSGRNFAINNYEATLPQDWTDEQRHAQSGKLFHGAYGFSPETGATLAAGFGSDKAYHQVGLEYPNQIVQGLNLGSYGINNARQASPVLTAPKTTVTQQVQAGGPATQQGNGNNILGFLNSVGAQPTTDGNGNIYGYDPTKTHHHAGSRHYTGTFQDPGAVDVKPASIKNVADFLAAAKAKGFNVLPELYPASNAHYHVSKLVGGVSASGAPSTPLQVASNQITTKEALPELGVIPQLEYLDVPKSDYYPQYYIPTETSKGIFDANNDAIKSGFTASKEFAALPADIQQKLASALSSTATANKTNVDAALAPGESASKVNLQNTQARQNEVETNLAPQKFHLDQQQFEFQQNKFAQTLAQAQKDYDLNLKTYTSKQTEQNRRNTLEALDDQINSYEGLIKLSTDNKGNVLPGADKQYRDAVNGKNAAYLKLLQLQSGNIPSQVKVNVQPNNTPKRAKITLPSGKEVKDPAAL